MDARAIAFAALIAAAACTAPPATPPPVVPAQPVAKPAPDPCERAAAYRARVPGLLEEGKLDRTVRVIRAANALCPATAPATSAVEIDTLAALGRWREATERAARAPDAHAVERTLAAQHARAQESVDALLEAARKEKAAQHAAEAQRLLDRAMARAEEETGQTMTLEVRNGLEASNGLPWDHNGGIFPRSLGVIWAAPAFSRDGKLAAIADGRRVLVVDRAARRVRMRLSAHQANVTALAWSPDGKLLASGSYDGSVRLWDMTTGQNLHALPTENAARALRFVRRGTVLVAVHEDASAWDVATGKRIARLAGSKGSAHAIDPDGIVTTADIGVPQERLDMLAGTPVEGPPPYAAAYSRDDTLGAVVLADGIEIRRYPGAKKVRKIAHKGNVTSLWMAADGKYVASGEVDEDYGPTRRVRVFRVADGKPLGSYAIEGDAGYGYEIRGFTADGKPIIGTGAAQAVIDPATGKPSRKPAPAERADEVEADDLRPDDALTPDAVAFSAGGKTLAIMLHQEVGEEWPSRLVLIDAAARTLRDLPGGRPTTGLAFAGSDKLVGWDWGGVARWDLASGKPTMVMDGDQTGLRVHRVIGGGRLAVLKGKKDEITVLDVATGEHLAARFPDKSMLLGEAAGGGLFLRQPDGKLALADARTGKLRVVAEPPATGEWTQAIGTRDGRHALLVAQESRSAERLFALPLGGGAPQPIGEPVETIMLSAAIGDGGVIVRTTVQNKETMRLLDVPGGAFTVTVGSELWEGGSITVAPGERIFADMSRPEAIVGFWLADAGGTAAVLRVLAGKKTAYVFTSDRFLEVIGDPADVLEGHAYCQAGVRVFPAEVCQERYLTRGLLLAALTRDPSYADP
jgi:dipeptidyl aminopeptidase/acylaminoacyl peptidase